MASPAKADSQPIPVKRALRKLGQDIREARLRRRITVAILAERSSIGVVTLRNIEKGSGSVAMGSYASVLHSLGLIDRISALADPRSDDVGQALEEENLPKRVRPSRLNTYKRKS